VGQNGTILTSLDGSQWTARVSGTSRWLNDVAWVDGNWFAVGTQGTVLTSSDASNWTDLGTITLKSLYAAPTDGTQLVLVGTEGVILRSHVVPDVAPISIAGYTRFASSGAQSIDNLFLFAGHADQRFTVDSLSGFGTNTWSVGPLVEFYDSSGTVFYLQ